MNEERTFSLSSDGLTLSPYEEGQSLTDAQALVIAVSELNKTLAEIRAALKGIEHLVARK